jgi:hypothetical protein
MAGFSSDRPLDDHLSTVAARRVAEGKHHHVGRPTQRGSRIYQQASVFPRWRNHSPGSTGAISTPPAHALLRGGVSGGELPMGSTGCLV